MNINGLHHVTAITAQAADNLNFYTRILGMRLVKKTVNQDDVSAYHLFYADKNGTPGTDMTFFDWSDIGPRQNGTDLIAATYFRVKSSAALRFWMQRLAKYKVTYQSVVSYGPFQLLRFTDPEGQELGLISDNDAPFAGEVWSTPDIPTEFALRGLFAVRLVVPNLELVETVFTRLLGWKKIGNFTGVYLPDTKVHAFGLDNGGPGKEVHVVEQMGIPSWPGAGNVHHVAFRVADTAELLQWKGRLDEAAMQNSGIIDRYYFQSLYFRLTPGILFELATDGPGFATDEPLDQLGNNLALPPFLEPRRAEIERGLEPLR